MDAIRSYGSEERRGRNDKQYGYNNERNGRDSQNRRQPYDRSTYKGGRNERETGKGSPANIEWDSTYNEDSQERYNDKNMRDRRMENNSRGKNNSDVKYYDQEYDQSKSERGSEDAHQFRDRERDRDRNKDRSRDILRDREIERELERARYGDRSERGLRDRERPRSPERERDWGRDRERGRTLDKDRRGSERDRSMDRSRERERDPYRDRERRRDDKSDRDRDRNRENEDRYPRGRRRSSAEREKEVEREKIAPSAHIMVRGSASVLTKEDELAKELQRHSLEYQDIKIVRNRLGESRGFGFVDFYDVQTAEKWMNLTKGTLMIGDSKFTLDYSKSKAPPSAYHQHDVDWYCSKCRTLNYASRKRITCFSCGEHRKDHPPEGHDDDDADDQTSFKDTLISAPPCNVLMIKGLDTNTSEEVIRNSLGELTSQPIYDVRLIKDKVTGISRGFCFVELGSTEDATTLLEKVQECDPAYFIEGRRVTAGFARNTPNPQLSKAKPAPDNRPRNPPDTAQAAKNVNLATVAIAQAQAAQQKQYAQAASDTQQATDTKQTADQPSVQSSQAAYQQPGNTLVTQQQQAQQYYQQQQQQAQQPQPQPQPQPQQQYPQSQQQNPYQNYTYDPSTGYYYDSNTGLYYDANTGYYYNGNTGKFLHWDAQRQQYFIVNQDGSLSQMDSEGNAVQSTATTGEKVKAKPTGSNAKKIAKDMERWAKKTNEAKIAKSNAIKQAQMLQRELEAKEELIRKQIQNEIMQNVAAAMPKSDAVKITTKSVFTAEDDDSSQSLAALIAAKTEPKVLASSLVAEYGDDSDDDQSEKLIDWSNLTCLLCKRQFPNKEILTKHQQMSDLHKQNLEKHKRKMRR